MAIFTDLMRWRFWLPLRVDKARVTTPSGITPRLIRSLRGDATGALEAVQLKQRQQEKADDHRVRALIGAAMVANVEAATKEEKAERKAYINDVLARNTVAESARAFLRVKGWL